MAANSTTNKPASRCPKKMQDLFFDTSLFSENIKIPGISFSNNPFDAHNGALVVNFNTVFMKVDSKGHVTSAEKQTPLPLYWHVA